MKVQISHSQPKAEKLTSLYLQAGLIKQDNLTKMLDIIDSNSTWFTARTHHGELSGLGRLITDSTQYGFIVDLIVVETHQRKGIGTVIMKAIIEQCRVLELDSVNLWPTVGKIPLYNKLGFQASGPEQPFMTLVGDSGVIT